MTTTSTGCTTATDPHNLQPAHNSMAGHSQLDGAHPRGEGLIITQQLQQLDAQLTDSSSTLNHGSSSASSASSQPSWNGSSMSASGTGMYHESNIIYHIPSADSSSTRGVHASAAADPTTTHKSRQRASLPLSSSSSSKDKHRSTPPASIKERRAEQNRNSQRTFRERKERHLKELEEQVAQGVEYARQLAVVTRENVLLKGLLLNKLHGGESSAATTMAATQVEKPAVVAQSIMSMDGESAPQSGDCSRRASMSIQERRLGSGVKPLSVDSTPTTHIQGECMLVEPLSAQSAHSSASNRKRLPPLSAVLDGTDSSHMWSSPGPLYQNGALLRQPRSASSPMTVDGSYHDIMRLRFNTASVLNSPSAMFPSPMSARSPILIANPHLLDTSPEECRMRVLHNLRNVMAEQKVAMSVSERQRCEKFEEHVVDGLCELLMQQCSHAADGSVGVGPVPSSVDHAIHRQRYAARMLALVADDVDRLKSMTESDLARKAHVQAQQQQVVHRSHAMPPPLPLPPGMVYAPQQQQYQNYTPNSAHF